MVAVAGMQHEGWACGLCSPQPPQGDARLLSEGEALSWAIRAEWLPQATQWAAHTPAGYVEPTAMPVPGSAPAFHTAAGWGLPPPPPPPVPPPVSAVDVIAAQAEAAELRLALQQALDSEAAASSRALGAELHAVELERQLLQGQGTAAALEASLAASQQQLAVAQQQAVLQAAAEQRAQRLEAELERVAADRATVQRQAEAARAEVAAVAQQLRDAQEQAKRAGECSRLVVEHAAWQAQGRGRLEEGAHRLEVLLAVKQQEAQQAAGVQREQSAAIQELQVCVLRGCRCKCSSRRQHRLCITCMMRSKCAFGRPCLGRGMAPLPQPTPNRPRRLHKHVECRTACTSRASAWLPARRAGAARWMRHERPRWDWGALLVNWEWDQPCRLLGPGRRAMEAAGNSLHFWKH